MLHILLWQIQRCIDTQTGEKTVSKKYLVLFKKIKLLIDQHSAENNTVSNYAEKLFITPHHLNHITRTVTGKTATQVVREQSMLKAKRLLPFTDYPVSEIASQLSYFDGSYFTKQKLVFHHNSSEMNYLENTRKNNFIPLLSCRAGLLYKESLTAYLSFCLK